MNTIGTRMYQKIIHYNIGTLYVDFSYPIIFGLKNKFLYHVEKQMRKKMFCTYKQNPLSAIAATVDDKFNQPFEYLIKEN